MGSEFAVSPLWGPRTRIMRGEPPRTIAGGLVNRLRHDIITGRLAPDTHLYFDRMRESYGVGISPLREALAQLAADGLVISEDHKGYRVAPLLLEEMMDVARLRIQLESLALRESIERGGDEWEVGIAAAHLRLTQAMGRLTTATPERAEEAADNWENRHREFHFALTAACASQWLLHFCDRLYDQIERYRRLFWDYPDRARLAAQEHEALKDAAIGRDVERAAAILADHFRQQAELTAEVMERRKDAVGEA